MSKYKLKIGKAKKILEIIDNIFDEKKVDKKIKKFFELSNELNELKCKNIKNNLNNNSSNIVGLPNCNNLLTICSLFYEELYNESLSNSGIPMRESPNILEDIINNNYKNSKQITLEINMLNFEIKIIRAGGVMNKYENNNFIDYFSSIFKKKQICEIRKVLFQLNLNDDIQKIKNDKNEFKKAKDSETQIFNFTLIIEEKEDNEIFCKLLKLKLYYILLPNINSKIYLNGTYTIDNNIVIIEQIKMDEIVLYFGNKEQKNYIHILNKESDDKKFFITKHKNDKYLGNKKLKKIYNYLGCKKYSIYSVLLSNKTILNEENHKNKFQLINQQFEDENFDDSNNKLFMIKDFASQASSSTSSMNQNNIISYNRGNKKIEKNKNIIKELNIIKYFLLFSLVISIIILFLESISLYRKYQSLSNNHNFYLLFQNYCNTFYNLFFSVLSLTCLANSTTSYSCRNYIEEVSKIFEEIGKNNLNEESSEINFININKLIFYQSQIYSEKLDNLYNDITYFLSKMNNNQFSQIFENELIHFKINQNLKNNEINLSLGSDFIDFNNFNLLMISRLSIITENIYDFHQPIYILNKTGEEVFNNVYSKEKLTSFQENIYLLILDYKMYCLNLLMTINKIINFITISKNKIKSLIYIFMTINFILFIIIIIILIFYLFVYYMIIFRHLRTIYNDLKEKIGDFSFKDILRNKLDNLKLMLNIYESDITKIIENLNDIYNDFKETHKQKIKEQSRLLKKELKFENNIKSGKKLSYIRIIQSINKYGLIKYSQRKQLYSYTLVVIILLYFIVYIINILIWYFFFQKQKKIDEWNTISENANGVTNNLMNNYIMMIYDNNTLEEMSMEMGGNDFITFIYEKLALLYELDNYVKYIQNLLKVTENTMTYECSKFFEDLKNELFIKIKNKFEEEKKKLIYTMQFFCKKSNLMIFNNYKTIYLQLFNRVKVDMENFNNYNYNDIIEFVDKNDIKENQIMFLIIYVYLMDIMSQNVQECIILMTYQIFKNIIITMILFLIALIIIIIIIFVIYIHNINHDCKKFLRIKKVFRICGVDE